MCLDIQVGPLDVSGIPNTKMCGNVNGTSQSHDRTLKVKTMDTFDAQNKEDRLRP